MPRHPIELARKHYEELPGVLKQALFSTEIAEQMFEIGKKFGLTIEKTGIMAEETGYIMLGLTRPNELVTNLAAELGIDSDKAQDVAAEISHQIFFPLREELKRTHDFDMDTGEIVGSGGPSERLASSSQAGMPLPPGINPSASLGPKKTFVEEKSPLVSDLTRVQESPMLPIPQKPSVPAAQPPPSFQPPASPTGRIDDLQKMVEKPPLPVTGAPPLELKPLLPALPQEPKEQPRPAPELFVSPSRKITDLKTISEKKDGGVEPWDKDLEKEVSSLLKPSPIDLRPQQKSTVPPPSMQTKLPPIDLRPAPIFPPRPAPPSVPRMTPQLQDLTRPAQLNITPTLLEENIKKAELKEWSAPPKSMPIANPISSPSAAIPGCSDPYREPVDETDV